MKHLKPALLLALSTALIGCGSGSSGSLTFSTDEDGNIDVTIDPPNEDTGPIDMTGAAICGAESNTDWTLDVSNSELNFLSIKKSHITESHTFTNLSGALNKEGKASLSVDLGSVDTGIEIRDERMAEHLFETSLFPRATASIQFTQSQLEHLTQYATSSSELTYTLDLHGFEHNLDIQTQITCVSDTQVLVKSAKPFVIGAADFGLDTGIEMLRQIASLDSISPFSIVDFTIVYEKGES